MENIPRLKAAFRRAYPDAPEPVVCRAPGRINLLGEHVDYNGLPVLPMTIDRDICVACAPRNDHRVRLSDREPPFPPAEFVNGPDIAPSPAGSWENYCKAAFQGLNRHFGVENPPGLDIRVSGDVPIAAGLSSSSALVVACALACLKALDKSLGPDISRIELATLLADAEQYVGTRGGGMDQAIILLGEEGDACKIDFHPLRAEKVPVFDEYVFVACNSLVKAEKTGAALTRYNEGPLSCRLIRALVEKQAQTEFGDEIELAHLADLWYGPLCLTNAEVASLFDAAFEKDTTTLEEAAAALDMAPQAIRDAWIGELPEPEGGFPLRARARHQLTEFKRVDAARDLALTGDAIGFGRLMNESHASCAQDYAVSCPELDELVAIARRAGSIGSRLTGAGFGGCTVNLVPAKDVDRFRATVERQYYRTYLPAHRIPCDESTLESSILLVRPTPGAGYLS
ncbi:MAG: galactokinase [Candidatus Hydrogenedentes bacterium]|nr:galactokinase [Candidatus Hydrogenedentota bacterium]